MIQKEDIIHALERLKAYIHTMPEEQFERVITGKPLFTAFLPYAWHFERKAVPDSDPPLARLKLEIESPR